MALHFPPDARLYLRPTGFVEAPFGHDGKLARLAGGMLWFSAVEVIAAGGGKRVAQELVPVERIGELGEAAVAQWRRLTSPRPPLTIGERMLRFDAPATVAILNITPDSFSDGGRYPDAAAAIAAGVDMAAAGAAIVDVGGESTRPGAKPVWDDDEISRVRPAVDGLARAGVLVSLDTRKAAVMRAGLAGGAGIVNDVSALTWDDEAARVVAEAGCPVVLMHHQGAPETMQKEPRYGDVLLDVYDWLEARIEAAIAAGIDRAKIIVDPGIGFGKTVRHNLELLNGVALLHGLGCPILLGASRKRFIGALSNEAAPDQRLGGSLAVFSAGLERGVQLFRVHDVAESVQAIRVWRGLRDAALTPAA